MRSEIKVQIQKRMCRQLGVLLASGRRDHRKQWLLEHKDPLRLMGMFWDLIKMVMNANKC